MGLNGFAKSLLLVLAIGITGIYIFIPSVIKISQQIKIKGSEKNLFLLLNKGSNWEVWLKKDSAKSRFQYHFKKNLYPHIFIEARSSDKIIPIKVVIQDVQQSDSSIIKWRCEIAAGISPWSRVQHYFEARDLKNGFSMVIKNLIDYTSETTNLYGINIAEIQVKDTLIATFSMPEASPPSNALLCKMIDSLRQQIKDAGLSITDSAMTAVQPEADGKYKMMVGFPVNKRPDAASRLVIKKMIPGKLLIGTAYGGPAVIKNAHIQIRKYIMDHNREEVALPYETSVTNRCIETDTSQWITKLCYPVY